MLPKFDYFKPATIDEAVNLLGQHGNDAKVLAGGTDLLVTMREGLLKPKYLIDVKEIEELNVLSYDKGKGLTIGAAVTLNDIIKSDIVSKHFAVLSEAVSTIADYEVRNRSTLIGNICNASPAADSAPALLVLDATVKTIGQKGERAIRIQEFFKGVKRTTLENNEMVKEVVVPTPPTGARGRYLKQKRVLSEDLALVGVAALVAPSSAGGRLLRIAFSSVAPTPVRIFEAEKAFEEDGPVSEAIDKVVSIVSNRLSPISDVRACKEYRAHLIEALTRRVLEELTREVESLDVQT